MDIKKLISLAFDKNAKEFSELATSYLDEMAAQKIAELTPDVAANLFSAPEEMNEAFYEKINVQGELGSSNPTRFLKALGSLKIAFRSPIKAGEAVSVLGKVFQDKELFAHIEKVAKDRPNSDIRQIVVARLRQLGFTQSKFL